MQASAVVVGIISFAPVVGYAGLSWLRRGRDPSFTDDSSILTAASPPAMTAGLAPVRAYRGNACSSSGVSQWASISSKRRCSSRASFSASG